eukprot:GHVL01037298.1.p1 GENE.GHVL01037298.1~~GHVL01037298.1.p1  ORF type:complete len:532 (+),score=101.88 GHVL01037298.1:11-1606(+)
MTEKKKKKNTKQRRISESSSDYDFDSSWSFCSACKDVNSSDDLDSLLICEGGCRRLFHLSCLQLSAVPEGSWSCEQCTEGIYNCSICGYDDQNVIESCSFEPCSRRYHKNCIKNDNYKVFWLSDSKFYCPVHYCLLCKDTQASKLENMIQCCKCCHSWHKKCLKSENIHNLLGEDCSLYSPSSIRTDFAIHCPLHNHPIRPMYHSINSDIISKPYQLNINHKKIYNIRTNQSLVWELDDLSESAQFDVNIQELMTSCTEALESANHSLVTMPDISLPETTNKTLVTIPEILKKLKELNLNDDFKNDIIGESAIETFHFPDFLNKIVSETDRKMLERASAESFKLIKSQLWLCPRPPKGSRDSEDICSCETPCDIKYCQNARQYTECNTTNCLYKDCHNRDISKRNFKKLQVVPAPGKGQGVVTTENIEPGELVYEYVGEVMNRDQWVQRAEELNENNTPHWYMMEIPHPTGTYVIDASRRGNIARYINHSCNPNCQAERWQVNGTTRIGIFARNKISELEENAIFWNETSV